MKLVYKYYAPEDYNLDAIEKQYFYFRHVSKLNDPLTLIYCFFSQKNIQRVSAQKIN